MHTHYYDPARSEWQCRECDTAADYCTDEPTDDEDTMNTEENTFRTEQAARDTRRELIGLGVNVSLIAYDPERQLFVFDIIQP